MTRLLQILCGITEGHEVEFSTLCCRLCGVSIETCADHVMRHRRWYAALRWWHAPARSWGAAEPMD